jgi:hypothetical protein
MPQIYFHTQKNDGGDFKSPLNKILGEFFWTWDN